ncbi:MAG TPA: hypothetical protein VMQ17_00885 [Candidatus Sulfotelmatobacter sp.]|jgi:signal transduction histidine kinase|nr:hypothetical protein [Candidatus Sulfotelmatobacter sp.]
MPHGWLQKENRTSASVIAHNLINSLTAIVGHSDLLIESTERGTEYARRLTLIRDIAESAAKELIEHRRTIEAEKRKAG